MPRGGSSTCEITQTQSLCFVEKSADGREGQAGGSHCLQPSRVAHCWICAGQGLRGIYQGSGFKDSTARKEPSTITSQGNSLAAELIAKPGGCK